MATDRIAIFPSRANFVLMKQRTASAQKGLGLLRRKRDALELHLRNLTKELKTHLMEMENLIRQAIFSMAKASFLNTDFKLALASKPQRADAHIRIQQTKIIGLTVPKFKLIMLPPTSLLYTGLATGGRQVDEVRKRFQEALQNLVDIASLQYSKLILEDAVHQTNMRVNGLDYVVIPRFVNTLNYIRDALEEYDREDFYRLKCSQAKQKIKKGGSKHVSSKASTTSIFDIKFTDSSNWARSSAPANYIGTGESTFMKKPSFPVPSIESFHSINANDEDTKPIESTSDIYDTTDIDDESNE